MTEKELNNEYFDWMCQLVCNERYSRGLSYQKLLRHLHNIDFQYVIPMDGNRAEDGIDLRYRFGYEKSYEGPMIASFLDNRPCSVLEMLIALAFRCEENIMNNPDVGNRMGQWFWNMIVNLGLGSMSDSRFNPKYTDDVIFRFMDRKYKRDGEGGLFTIEHCKYDMRSVEIWYANELDAMILWHLHEEFGFGPKRLKQFYDTFAVRLDELIKHYEMTDSDMVWLCTYKLKQYGIDIEEWNKQRRD